MNKECNSFFASLRLLSDHLCCLFNFSVLRLQIIMLFMAYVLLYVNLYLRVYV